MMDGWIDGRMDASARVVKQANDRERERRGEGGKRLDDNWVDGCERAFC